MISLFLRRDLKAKLLRFSGNVGPQELEDIIERALLQDPDPPFDLRTLVDTRDAETYDMSFIKALGLTSRLEWIYERSGHRLDAIILVQQNWKFGLANMFAVAASASAYLSVRVVETESDVLRAADLPEQDLAALFPPSSLHIIARSAE